MEELQKIASNWYSKQRLFQPYYYYNDDRNRVCIFRYIIKSNQSSFSSRPTEQKKYRPNKKKEKINRDIEVEKSIIHHHL